MGSVLSPSGHLRADMSTDCPFCQIIAGDIPARVVYEDDDVLSFLDANPLARGHTLVVPKTHHERVTAMPDDDRDAVFGALGRLGPSVQAAVDADGLNVGMNDGSAAGQEVPHVHGHLVPRFEGDDGGAVHSIVRTRPDLPDGEMNELEADIRDAAE